MSVVPGVGGVRRKKRIANLTPEAETVEISMPFKVSTVSSSWDFAPTLVVY